MQRIVQSPYFLRAETLRRLLLYMWEHRSETLSEYGIATEGLGRKADFDPRTDATVRVQVSRLRRKLRDYYRQEPTEPELLYIPTGSHAIAVADVPIRPVPLPQEPQPIVPKRTMSLSLWLSAVCITCVLLLGTTLWLWYARSTRATASQNSASDFWSSFVGKNQSLKILIPTPAFYSFSHSKKLRVRAVDVNDPDAADTSPEFKEATNKLGSPVLEHTYTVTSDTLAVLTLTRYLDSVGLGKQVSVEVTGDSNTQELDQDNVIVMGAHSTLYQFNDYLATMSFKVAATDGSISRAATSNSPAERYAMQRDGGERAVLPSVIALLPWRGPGYKLLLVDSTRTSAVIAFLTSHAGDQMLRKMLHANGDPAFFEMVLLTELQGEHALRSWPVSLHAYQNPAK